MINVNKFLKSDTIGNITEVYLEIRVFSDKYNIHNLKEKDHLDTYSVIVSQNDKDRKKKKLYFDVNSDNKKINIELSSQEKATVIDYIIENELDLKYGLKLIKRRMI